MVAVVGYYSVVKLTGKQRVRRSWRGKLILQVEVEEIYIHPLGKEWFRRNADGISPGTRFRWRDATEEDVNIKYAMVKING